MECQRCPSADSGGIPFECFSARRTRLSKPVEAQRVSTVREFERHEVAAIHIEDQEFPKKCGHLDGKQIVSREEYTAKIRAALAARRDKDFLIIARTDARAVAGHSFAVIRPP